MSYYSSPNRYVCSVLEEMREQLKLLEESYNVDRYKSLTSMMIEEVQTLVNIMEAGLSDQRDLLKLKEERRKLRNQVKKLKLRVNKLKEQLGEEIASNDD